jgi:peroxiredoxin
MRAAALALALLALGACAKQPEEKPAAAAPAGTISELKADSSITTDVNARAPAFARADFSGGLVRTQDAIGNKVMLLDFWSVFCKSCLEEMPFLKGLHERYGAAGLEIVGVNTDFFPKERIERFMAKTDLRLPYRLIHDRDQSLAKLFSVEALPVLVLIDSAGWIRMVHLGYRPDDERMIESRVRQACDRIKETVVTLQPVSGSTDFSPPQRGQTLLAPGSAVESFPAVEAGGSPFDFASWRGTRPAVVFFWSIFCQPCRQEFGALARLGRSYAAQGLQVLAVNIDSPKLRPAAVRLLAAEGQGLAGVFDQELEGGRYRVAGQFGVSATPSTFLVGRDGTVRGAWAGEVAEAVLAQGIAGMLAAGSAASPGGGR